MSQFERPSGAYAGAAGLANRTKYQDDAVAVPRQPISSAKMDGEFNYVVDGLNTLAEARGSKASIAERLDVNLNADGTFKASVVAALDIVRKLRAPYQPELAIGSIDESGWSYIADYAEMTGADNAYIESEKHVQMETIKKRRAQYTPVRESIDPAGRIVIVVDDGLATGATMISALHGLRNRKPSKLICAVPVSPPDTIKKVAALADEVVCLEVHSDFQAVGQYYEAFPQVEDEEVINLLRS